MNISSFYINKKSKIFENILLIFILSILAYFLVFLKTNFKIMSNAVEVFLKILLPSLFPFILFSNILTFSGSFDLIANSNFNKFLQHIFKISSYGASSIIFGFLFGYPNGAKYVNELYEKSKINYEEAEYLLLFINNASPTFILSSIGIGIFKNIYIGILLLVSHIIAALLTGILYRFKYKYKLNKEININTISKKDFKNNIHFSFDILYNSISKSLLTLGIIFGFMTISILLYNYIIKILEYIIPISNNIKSALLCIVEISSGLKEFINTTSFNLKKTLPFISFFLGFSSLSIILQIFSCVYLSKFKLKKILKGKLTHGILSYITTYILVNLPYIYEYINIGKEVNLNIDNTVLTSHSFNNHLIISIGIFAINILILIPFILSKRKRLRITS